MRRVIRRLAPALLVLAATHCRDDGPDVTPAKIVVAPFVSGAIPSGTSMPMIVTVTNAGGDVLTGNTIQWTTSDAEVATVSLAGAVIGVHVGDAQITASIGTVHSLPVTVTIVPGTPSQLGIRTQPSGGASGVALGTQPVVEILDAAANLVTSSTVTVTAVIATGGGSLTGSTASAVAGVATFSAITISGPIGDRTLTFSVSGIAPVTSSGFAVGAGAPAKLVVRTQPTGAAAGTPLATQPAVEIRDDADNLVISSTATITAALGSGGGTVTGGLATAAKGIAEFSNLIISGIAGAHTLIFSSPGLRDVASATFTMVAGPAAGLRMHTQPGGALSGQPLNPQPVVDVVDVGGNLASGPSVTVTANVASGGGSVAGGIVPTVGGVATFTGLSVSGSGGVHTLTFSASALTPVTSAPFSVTSSPPVRLVVQRQPGGATSGLPLLTQPIVAAVDANGNVATNYSGIVVATGLSNVSHLTGSIVNIVNGIGVFQSLTVFGSNGTVFLSFSSGTLTSVTTSFPLGPVSGPSLRLVIRIFPPSSVKSGVPVSPQPVIEVQDANGIVVTSNATITFTTDAVSGTIANGTAVAVNGVATFSGLTLSGPFGGRDYIFTSPGMQATGILRIDINP